MPDIKPTQADRGCAAKLYDEFHALECDDDDCGHIASIGIRAGSSDDNLVVQAFVHHREQATAPLEAEILRLRIELTEARYEADLIGQRVIKRSGDYTFDGEIRGVITKRSGAVRYVVEDDRGLLLIMNANQLGRATAIRQLAEGGEK